MDSYIMIFCVTFTLVTMFKYAIHEAIRPKTMKQYLKRLDAFCARPCPTKSRLQSMPLEKHERVLCIVIGKMQKEVSGVSAFIHSLLNGDRPSFDKKELWNLAYILTQFSSDVCFYAVSVRGRMDTVGSDDRLQRRFKAILTQIDQTKSLISSIQENDALCSNDAGEEPVLNIAT